MNRGQSLNDSELNTWAALFLKMAFVQGSHFTNHSFKLTLKPMFYLKDEYMHVVLELM